MRKPAFLAKLHKEGKLELVEPSDEISQAYAKRADESLVSSKTLAEIGNLRDSIALSYYAMYHSLLSLLFQVGIKSENHSVSIQIMEEVFDLDSISIKKAKKERIDKQYYVSFEITLEETKNAIHASEAFILHMHDFISRINKEDILNYRKKFLRKL
ncbi:MAG TPA: HEPN domain-containing protein [Candidatus Nanoarchaeia archaeon]|nr:HEPN domain-containing protein [Candidatus Nanoarchaeia archaeon]